MMMGEKNERSDLLVRSRMTKVIDPLDDPDKLGDLDDLEDFVGRDILGDFCYFGDLDVQGGWRMAVRRLRDEGHPEHVVRPRGEQPCQRFL